MRSARSARRTVRSARRRAVRTTRRGPRRPSSPRNMSDTSASICGSTSRSTASAILGRWSISARHTAVPVDLAHSSDSSISCRSAALASSDNGSRGAVSDDAPVPASPSSVNRKGAPSCGCGIDVEPLELRRQPLGRLVPRVPLAGVGALELAVQQRQVLRGVVVHGVVDDRRHPTDQRVLHGVRHVRTEARGTGDRRPGALPADPRARSSGPDLPPRQPPQPQVDGVPHAPVDAVHGFTIRTGGSDHPRHDGPVPDPPTSHRARWRSSVRASGHRARVGRPHRVRNLAPCGHDVRDLARCGGAHTRYATGSVTKSMSSSTRPSSCGSRSANVRTCPRIRCQARAMSACSACGHPSAAQMPAFHSIDRGIVGQARQSDALGLDRLPDVDERVPHDEHVRAPLALHDGGGEAGLLGPGHQVVDEHPDPTIT